MEYFCRLESYDAFHCQNRTLSTYYYVGALFYNALTNDALTNDALDNDVLDNDALVEQRSFMTPTATPIALQHQL